jgi:hypothetical protein
MATDLGYWEAGRQLNDIYVDGDACPVREEIYRAAARMRRIVLVVPNGSRPIRPPGTSNLRMVLVGDTQRGLMIGLQSTSQPSTYASPPISRWRHAVSKKGRALPSLLANIGRRRISVTHALAGRPSRFCSSSGSKAVSVAFRSPTTPRRASGTGVRAVRQSAPGPRDPLLPVG